MDTLFSLRWAITIVATCLTGQWIIAPVACQAADEAQIVQTIQRAAGWLDANFDQIPQSGEVSLAALALVKAEYPKNHPAIRTAIQGIRENKMRDGAYIGGTSHVYEAGVDINLLVDVDPEQLRPEIEAITNYLIETQRDNGSWDYPSASGERNGDTSVTQYAALGLWAASRAGLEVPIPVWDKLLDWQISTQLPSGGFTYVPGTTMGHENGGPSLNLTCGGLGTLLIAARHVFPDKTGSLDELLESRATRDSGPRRELVGGALERVDLGAPRDPTISVAGPVGTTSDLGRIQQAARRAFGWVAGNFVAYRTDNHYPAYYYYSVERMGSLANVQQVGRFDWFHACADQLIAHQEPTGEWEYVGRPWRATSFIILFLSRSTAQILGRQIPQETIGGGLMAGGRLPGGDLSSFRVDGSGLIVQAKDLGPLDEMLASLSDLGDAGIDEVQQQIVEKVQIGDRQALIENKERLVELVAYRNPGDPEHAAEVRRTAVWAIGRTNDLSLVRHLIEALDDVSFTVMMESRNALCWLARRPNGLGEANDPLQSLPENASPDQRQAAISAWHAETFRNWGRWFLENRPYEERGDEFEAWLLDRMSQL